MTQEIKTNITIQIPDEYILIEKVKLEELQQETEPEWVAGLNWLSGQTGIKSPQQLKNKILYPFKGELIKFVVYPNNAGEVWRFNTSYMKQWLRKNFMKVVSK